MSEQGCSDGNCKLRLTPVTGQHTNGGCRCLRYIQPKLRIAIERKLWSQRCEIERLRKLLNDIVTELYGEGYEVAGFHNNGDLEPLDNWFIDNGWLESIPHPGASDE